MRLKTEARSQLWTSDEQQLSSDIIVRDSWYSLLTCGGHALDAWEPCW